MVSNSYYFERYYISLKILSTFYDGDEEKTEVIYPNEDIIGIALQDLSKTRKSLDIVGDYDGPRFLVTNELIATKYLELKNRGVKIRQITEITKENIPYCRKAMEFSELRHLDGVKGTYGINDTRTFGSIIIDQETKKPLHFVHSNVKPLVEQEQYLFETLWNKGIPGEDRIREIEEGIQPERTEVISGWQNLFNRYSEIITRIKERMDVCYDASGPAIIANSDPILQAGIIFVRRGGKIRFITEITKENIGYVKELMKIQETRHLDGVRGNFSVSEQHYGASAAIDFATQNPQFVFSNFKEIVKQHQYLFEMLWERAMTAEQRIKEIEEGRAPEKLEIIQDTQKSTSRAFDIMNKTHNELLVLFATPRTFTLALRAGAADIYRKISENGVNIKLLIPRGVEIQNEQIAKVREISPSINLRVSDVDLNTRITIMISDRKEFMSWELRDDTLDDPYLAGGMATYSNIKALASSYAIIFDNLWKITEFAENLHIANVKLEINEKAMKEFINIAAHELRTPLQPILGLSEMLADASNDPQQQRRLFEIIVRNAHKLENLAENILDVTRIESRRLQLSTERVDLHKLVESVVSDFQAVIENEFDKNENSSKAVISLKEQFSDDRAADPNREHPMVVLADASRIVQVIANLLSNAVKFSTQRDRAIIRVTTGRRVIDGKPMAIVSISDEGQGISPEIMPRLFQKFISGSEKGTGLGLYISKNIVKAHGGEIWAENNKSGIGATFAFTLPLLKS
jgi:two-component system, OmpR family, sensor histidine kinase VicK